MDKVYPVIYDQQNYSDELGTMPSATVASDGCFVSCFAMKAGYYGHIITPPELNKLFTNFNGNPIYINSDLLPDNALSIVFPDIKYVKTLDYEPIPTDLQNIKTLLADPSITLTIRIRFKNNTFHFVEAVACDGNTLHIANPWSGKIEDFSQNYGDPVTANLHVIIYSGQVPQPAPVVAVDPTPSPLAQRFNQAITKATNFDAVADYLGITQDQRVTTIAGLIAVEKYKQLQSELQQTSEDLQKLRENPPTAAPQVVVQTAAPAPAAPTVVQIPVSSPTFSDGTMPIPATPPVTVPTKSPAIVQAQKLGSFSKLWRAIAFWLG